MEPWNTIHVLCVFLVALVLCHVAFAWKWKRSALFWKKVDYVWVALSVLALISIPGEIRRTRTEWLLHRERTLTAARSEDVRKTINLNIHTHTRDWVRSDLSPPDFDTLVATNQAFLIWLHDLRVALPDSTQKDAYTQFQTEFRLPQFYKGEFTFELGWIKRTIEEASEAEVALAALESDLERSDLEIVLLFMSPWFLGIALALRLTKVTGEVYLERQKISSS